MHHDRLLVPSPPLGAKRVRVLPVLDRVGNESPYERWDEEPEEPPDGVEVILRAAGPLHQDRLGTGAFFEGKQQTINSVS